jgi:hypothetical protein
MAPGPKTRIGPRGPASTSLAADRLVAFEPEVGVRPHELLEPRRKLATGIVGVDCRHDGDASTQVAEEAPEDRELQPAWRARGAQIPAAVRSLAVELMVAERIDGALGDDDEVVVGIDTALPRGLGAPRSKPCEAAVFDLESGELAAVVAMGEEDIAARVLPPGARKARVTERFGA